jgi:hypothetical protein
MLECWSTGIMGLGLLQYWVNGKIFHDDKFKIDDILMKTHSSIIPRFHYSMVETRTHASIKTAF